MLAGDDERQRVERLREAAAHAAIVPDELTPDVERYREFCLRMDHLATAPYLEFVYGDGGLGDEVQAFLFDHGLAEASPPYGRVLLRDGEPQAMFSFCIGDDLRRIRLKAAVALSRLDLPPDVQDRARLAGTILLRPEPCDLYLSRLSVPESLRGIGTGYRLMRGRAREVRDAGFDRMVAEVHPSAKAMLRLYQEGFGFEIVAQLSVEDPKTGKRLETLHVAKDLRRPLRPTRFERE